MRVARQKCGKFKIVKTKNVLYLIFAFQRTGFQAGIAFKREDKVVFPLCLNMDKFIYSQQLYQRKSTRLTRSVTIDLQSRPQQVEGEIQHQQRNR